jgi:Tfp pilus assembly protein FimT
MGLTLIELMIVVAVLATLVVLTAPSFQRMIETQRLRSINAALLTDLQFARAEAASRNERVWVRFNGTGTAFTCYVILTGDATACNCQNTATNVCVAGSANEIRTVRVQQSLGVTVAIPSTQTRTIMGFDPATGRLWGVPVDIPEPATAPFQIQVRNPSIGGFLDEVELTGRPTTCSPGGQLTGVPSCS